MDRFLLSPADHKIGSWPDRREWNYAPDFFRQYFPIVEFCFRRVSGEPASRHFIVRAEKPALAANFGYIGGITPLFPTTTRLELSVPSASRWALTKTVAPGLRSAGVAGAKVTTGVLSGIEIFLVCPLS